MIIDKNLHLLNDGSPTFYRASQDHYSFLDLTVCSNNISNSFDWGVYHDRLSSDHFPIFINIKNPEIYTTKLPKYKFAEANWHMYRNSVSLPDTQNDCNVYNSAVVNAIINSCNLAIPKQVLGFLITIVASGGLLSAR